MRVENASDVFRIACDDRCKRRLAAAGYVRSNISIHLNVTNRKVDVPIHTCDSKAV